ncbi:MAG TPA: FAD-binding oxidoreductase [Polyangiaceae bacterium]|jgi:glycolate oxidase|nr:MAG: 4-cresol dehydrogenase (hydroxylating) flavoprotein subunit [Deltaproteobacteria bacterium ADurb.Bin207]HNS99224.1 FAD-binding oxidoreductase [Polyangiaceae bacterium]HNZ23658.1 FAD-binding oxidoreductase [Polyangiaceae bacterium]HOD22426.1 FAD-binding oxidoreductase [Polyangiaceae bacterium]HOE47803.1 FAD-binding oxidoreductase [Polyangiaceae bacterium]
MIDRLERLLGRENVVSDPSALAAYDDDYSEVESVLPAAVVLPTTVPQVQAIVRFAGETGICLTPRVAGTNVGGLAIPTPRSIVVDFRRMNRVLEVYPDDRVAVIEPGVTQQQLKDHLDSLGLPLTFGFSLGPRRSSVLANCCLDGLHNRSLKYGAMGQSVSGFEVVLADGSLMRTGAWALSDIPFARSPLPDLSGLFVGWQGTTGLVTKVGFHLAHKHPFSERLFVLAYSVRGTFEAMRRLSRMEFCDDIGGLSWPTGKMMLGVTKPHPIADDGEPRFFLYVDLTAERPEQLVLKRQMLEDVLSELRQEGQRYEEPIGIETLVTLNPAMGAFASFPTDLGFLTDHPGGGLTWVGTYGPLSRFDDAAHEGIEVMVRHGFAPAIVSRSMKEGHFGVLRFLSLFDKKKPQEIEIVKRVNLELLHAMTARGFIMYKTPSWALREWLSHIDPGFLSMMRKVKTLLDPQGIFNPGKLLLPWPENEG